MSSNAPVPELREKQVEQLAFYIAHPKCMDLSDPGTGKTPPVCVYAYYHWARKQAKTLWTMPKSLLKKNKKEMERFTDFVDEDVVILKNDRADMTQNWTGPTIASTRARRGWKLVGPVKDTVEYRDLADKPINFVYQTAGYGLSVLGTYSKKAKSTLVEPLLGPDGVPQKMVRNDPEVFKDLIEANKGAKVFICTFAFASAHWERILKANPSIDLFLVDEIHMPGGYSTPGTAATESFFWINRHVKHMVVMTGTLINGRLDTAFPAIHAIEPRYYGGLTGFLLDHAAFTDDYGRVVTWKNEDKLRKIIERHSIRRTFEEVYGKEPVVFFTEYVEMEDKVQEQYDKFEDTALLELDDGRVLDGSLPGVSSLRARQLLAHPETMLKGISEWTPRDERIALHLSEGKKALIFAALVPEQERLVSLCKSLGLRVALINAGVSGPARAKIDEQFQAGLIDVIVASGPTAAVGYNWQQADLVMFASMDYMDTNILQAYRRASRGSRTSILRVIFIRYSAAVEDRTYEIITNKSRLANKVDPTRPILEFTE